MIFYNFPANISESQLQHPKNWTGLCLAHTLQLSQRTHSSFLKHESQNHLRHNEIAKSDPFISTRNPFDESAHENHFNILTRLHIMHVIIINVYVYVFAFARFNLFGRF